jgi:integrase/recombinase XerD
MKQHVLRYLRGDVEGETIDIYTRVDRDEAREEYPDCMKPLGL